MLKTTLLQKKSQAKKSEIKENLSNISTEPEFLNDVNEATGKKRDWDNKKKRSQLLAESLFRISQKDSSYKGKNFKVHGCGDYLEFTQIGETMKLHKAFFVNTGYAHYAHGGAL